MTTKPAAHPLTPEEATALLASENRIGAAARDLAEADVNVDAATSMRNRVFGNYLAVVAATHEVHRRVFQARGIPEGDWSKWIVNLATRELVPKDGA